MTLGLSMVDWVQFISGIEPVAPAVEAGRLLHWTTGEVPGFTLDVEHPMGLDKFTMT